MNLRLLWLLAGGLLCGCCTSSPDGVVQGGFRKSLSVIEQSGGVTETAGVFYIPADEEWIYSESVEIRAYGAIIIDGVMRGLPPQDPRIPAPTMTLSSCTGVIIRGEVHGFPGADGSSPGANGGDAGALVVHAPILVLNDRLTAPTGGAGYPDDGRGAGRKHSDDEGRGGTGGRIVVYAQVIGRYTETQENGLGGFANIVGGTGGYGGGNGGSSTGGLFRELPWMVEYRENYLLQDREIEAARERGEID